PSPGALAVVAGMTCGAIAVEGALGAGGCAVAGAAGMARRAIAVEGAPRPRRPLPHVARPDVLVITGCAGRRADERIHARQSNTAIKSPTAIRNDSAQHRFLLPHARRRSCDQHDS